MMLERCRNDGIDRECGCRGGPHEGEVLVVNHWRYELLMTQRMVDMDDVEVINDNDDMTDDNEDNCCCKHCRQNSLVLCRPVGGRPCVLNAPMSEYHLL